MFSSVTSLIHTVLSLRRNTENKEANQEKQSAENGEPNNTQGNGPLEKENIQTGTPSPRKVSENGTRAQNKDTHETPAHSGQPELLQCTLNSPQTDQEVPEPQDPNPEEETPAAEKDKKPDGCSPTAEVVRAENTSHTDTDAEQIAASPVLHNHEEEEEKATTTLTVYGAAAKPSEETAQNNEALSAPNTQLAEAADQMSSISVVSEETKTEPLSW